MSTTRIIIIAICAIVGLGVGAVDAEQRINERLKAPRDGEVEIENIAGRIVVEGWDKAEVEVTGTMDDDLELRFDSNERRTVVRVKYPERRGARHQSADLLVRVPVASRVSVEGVSADVEGRSLSGELEFQSVSGSVELDVQSSSIDAESVSGDVEVRAKKALIDAESVSGDIEVHFDEGEVDAETVSGDVEIVAENLTRAEAQSISGDIDVTASLAKGSRVELESHSGDIDLSLPADSNAELDLETYSGSMRIMLEARRVGGDGERELELVLGKGEARVEMSSFSGDLTVRSR